MKKILSQTIRFLFISMGIIAFLFYRCDHGLEPIYSKITGEIYFRGEIPPHTDEVRVVVAKDFPPRKINELLFSNQVNFREDTFTYEIYLSKGTYNVIAVIWKENNQSWNVSNIIGGYDCFFSNGRLIPNFIPVTIPDNNTVVENINMTASLDLVIRDAKIEGIITFTGTWPVNTGIMGVGAFVEIPKPNDFMDYYFKSVYIDYGVATFVTKANYSLRVNSTDTLKYIAALWMDNTYNLSSFRDVGFYPDPGDTTGNTPGIVTVPPDSIRKGIDILVDFNQM